jgi:hypothetical protein
VHSRGAGLAVTEAGTEIEDYRTTSWVLASVVSILAQNLWGWAVTPRVTETLIKVINK